MLQLQSINSSQGFDNNSVDFRFRTSVNPFFVLQSLLAHNPFHSEFLYFCTSKTNYSDLIVINNNKLFLLLKSNKIQFYYLKYQK